VGWDGHCHRRLSSSGQEILDIIIAYCVDKNLPVSTLEIDLTKKTSKIIVDSKRISFELFESGKTIEEIAKERGMAVSTIEGHLAWFVGNGELPVDRLISLEKLEKISGYLQKNFSTNLSPIKSALGYDVSWADLRFVLQHLEFKKKEK